MDSKRTVDRERLLRAVSDILAAVGEDPDRPGLVETPRRVADMYLELFAGLDIDPVELIDGAIFDEGGEGGDVVTVTDIWFDSMCEHHLLPFRGTVEVSYEPADGRVVGLSKLARVVDVIARRPQVQERMTRQIVEAIASSSLAPRGVKVSIEAEHLCMSVRGVRKNGATTLTSSAWGSLADGARQGRDVPATVAVDRASTNGAG